MQLDRQQKQMEIIQRRRTELRSGREVIDFSISLLCLKSISNSLKFAAIKKR